MHSSAAGEVVAAVGGAELVEEVAGNNLNRDWTPLSVRYLLGYCMVGLGLVGEEVGTAGEVAGRAAVGIWVAAAAAAVDTTAGKVVYTWDVAR